MPSTVIKSFHYDPEARTLEVIFVTRRRYRYFDVPQEVASEMRAAFAKGEFFNAAIRGRYRFEKLAPSEESVRNVTE